MKDVNNNLLSGVATFAAPKTGASAAFNGFSVSATAVTEFQWPRDGLRFDRQRAGGLLCRHSNRNRSDRACKLYSDQSCRTRGQRYRDGWSPSCRCAEHRICNGAAGNCEGCQQ